MQAAGGTQTLGWRRGREEQEGQLGQEGGGLRKSGITSPNLSGPALANLTLILSGVSVAVFSLNFPRPFTGAPQNMLRAAMIMMLCCVSDAFVLQPAASRALAPARHSSVAQMLLPTEMLLPMTSLAEAGQAVAMKETPWALIVAGCVVTTLSAGFPVYATAITPLVTPLCTHPCAVRAAAFS